MYNYVGNKLKVVCVHSKQLVLIEVFYLMETTFYIWQVYTVLFLYKLVGHMLALVKFYTYS